MHKYVIETFSFSFYIVLRVIIKDNNVYELFILFKVFQEVAPKHTNGLPWWFVYIGWFILFCAVSLSGFFVVFYSLQWGPKKSRDWFISMMTAFLESILILEPLKVTDIMSSNNFVCRSVDLLLNV